MKNKIGVERQLINAPQIENKISLEELRNNDEKIKTMHSKSKLKNIKKQKIIINGVELKRNST